MLLPTLVLLAASASMLRPPSDAAERFATLLQRDDIKAFQAIATPDADLASVTDLLERYVEIEATADVASASALSATTTMVDLIVSGAATTAGTFRSREALPARWSLEIVTTDAGWRIKSARTSARAAALRAAAISDVAAIRASMVDDASVDLRLAIRELAAARTQRSTEAAVALARDLGDAAELVNALRQRVISGGLTSSDRAALVAEAAAIAARSCDPDTLADAHFAAANLHFAEGRVREASGAFAAVAELLDSVRDPRTPLKGEYMHSFAESRLGNMREAIRSAQRLQSGARRYGWHEGEAMALTALSTAHGAIRSAASCRYAREALEVSQRNGITKMTPVMSYNVAQCGYAEKMDDQSLKKLQASFVLIGDEDTSLKTSALIGLGTALLQRGELAAAAALARGGEAVAARSATYPDFLIFQSDIALARKEPMAALEIALKAQSEISRRVTPAAPNSILLSGIGCAAAKARALRDLGRNDEAIAAYRDAIALIEEHRDAREADETSSARFLGGDAGVYRELTQLLVARGKIREALLVTEKTRARALRDVIAGRRRAISSDERERDLQRAVTERSREWLASLGRKGEAETHAALTEARDATTAYRTELYLRDASTRVRRGDAGDTLPPDGDLVPDTRSALVSYVVGEDETLAFVLTRAAGTGLRIAVLRLSIGAADLKTRVARVLQAIDERDLDHRGQLRALYDILLAPLTVEIGQRERLCIVPDGPLWHVPFAALIDRRHRFALQRWTISYASALATLSASRPIRSRNASLLAFGNPTLQSDTVSQYRALERGTSLGRLPHAESEVRQIAGLYRHATVLTGGLAGEASAKREAGSYGVLHFATHAVIDDDAPLYSALVLAGTGQEDGLLEAREILDLRLNADLAVLSACETARGSFGPGEGVIGLAWAMMVAGCPRTIVSGWRIDSESTAQLMVTFHRKLTASKEGADPAAALRRAQLAMLEHPKFSHPYYWAAFSLVGYGW